MKTTILIATLALAAAFAQQKDDVHEGRGVGIGIGIGSGSGCPMTPVAGHMKILSGRMSLSSEQDARLRGILKDEIAAWEPARTDPARVRKLRAEAAAKVRDALSGDQRRSFDELQREGQNCSLIWSQER